MKAYKIVNIENININRILCVVNNQTLVVATPSEPQYFIYNSTLDALIKRNEVEEINLLDQPWIHPHLYKPLKKEVENLLTQKV